MTNWYVSTNGNAKYSGTSETLKESGNTATISSKVLTDTNANFNSIEDNVDYVHIISGTGVTAGYYKITSHTATTITLETDPGDSSAGDVEYYVGGALTLDEGIDNIFNGGILQNGEVLWIKADGIYERATQLTISVGGTADKIKGISGYSSIIGDNGRAEIKYTGGSLDYFLYNSRNYISIRNLILDGNNNITNSGARNTSYYSFPFINMEVKNCNNGFFGHAINCIAHDNTTGFLSAYFINCLSYNNATGYEKGFMLNCIACNNTNRGFNVRESSFILNCIAYGNPIGIYMIRVVTIINTIIANSTTYGIQSYYNATNSKFFNNNLHNIAFYNNNADINNNMSYDDIDTYYIIDPQFKDPDNFDFTRAGDNLSDKGFSTVGLLDNPVDYNIDIGIDQMKIPDFPSENDVRENVDYDNGNKTGNLQLPATTDVRESVGYGSNGTEKVGSLDLPSENDVRLNTKYDNNSKTGKLDLPSTHDVEQGVKYDQNNKVGEFVVPDEENVKKNVSYGYNNEFTGTLETTNIELPLEVKVEIDGEININVEVE